MKKRKQFIAQVLSIALSCSIVNSYTPLPSVMASTTEENIQNTEDAEKVYGYGTMTMTYQEFYAGDVNNAGDIDAVSSATTTKNTLFSNADTTEPTESGYQIKGVKNVPVRVMESASEELKTRVSFNEKETELPTQYKLIDRNGIGAFFLACPGCGIFYFRESGGGWNLAQRPELYGKTGHLYDGRSYFLKSLCPAF